jgi:hypothetical protein
MQELTTAAAPWNGVCPPPHPEMAITTAGAGLTTFSASSTSGLSESSLVSLSPPPHWEAPPQAGRHPSKDGHGVQTDMSSSASPRTNEKCGVQAPGTPTLDQVLGSPLLEQGDGWGGVDEGRRLLEERTPLLTVSGVTLANNEQNLKSTLSSDIYIVDILCH